MLPRKEKFVDYKKISEDYAAYGDTAITDWLLGFYKIYKYLLPVKRKAILDYGCGDGKFCRFLRDQGAETTGVDISSDMIEIAKRNNAKSIHYQKIESGELDFIPSESFDACTMTFVLCTLYSQAEMLKILKEIYRVLKHHGILIMLNVNWEKSHGKEFISFKMDTVDSLTPGEELGVLLKGTQPIRVQEYFWPIQEYCDLFIQAGFEITRIDEPTAEDEEHDWLDEKNFPPFAIIGAKKP